MARRSDHTRDEIRQMAIQNAIQIIRDKGMKHFSARKLATSIGYTVGTLYNVFGSYDELILAINLQILEMIQQQMGHDLSKAPKNPIDRLKIVVDTYTTFTQEQYDLWQLLFHYRQESKDSFPEPYGKVMRSIVKTVKDIINGIVNDEEKAYQMTLGLWSFLHGASALKNTHYFALSNGPENLKEFCFSVVDSLFGKYAQ